MSKFVKVFISCVVLVALVFLVISIFNNFLLPKLPLELQNKVTSVIASIVIILGVFRTITGITGYNLRDLFSSKEKIDGNTGSFTNTNGKQSVISGDHNIVDQSTHNHYKQPDSSPSEPESNPISDRYAISERLQYVINSMRESPLLQGLTVEHLADYMVDEMEVSYSNLHDYIDGTQIPNKAFLNSFAETFGIDKGWLSKGDGHPFRSPHLSYSRPLKLISYIKELPQLPLKVFFVKNEPPYNENDDPEQHILVIIKMSDQKYIRIDLAYDLLLQKKCDYDNRDRHQRWYRLISFYKLVGEITSDDTYTGLQLNCRDFSDLFSGEHFPGEIIESSHRIHIPWHRHLCDVEHTIHSKEKYLDLYGYEFVNSQRFLDCFYDTEHQKYSEEQCIEWYGNKFIQAQELWDLDKTSNFFGTI